MVLLRAPPWRLCCNINTSIHILYVTMTDVCSPRDFPIMLVGIFASGVSVRTRSEAHSLR